MSETRHRQKTARSRCGGFTLVEIAIVMVIIGVLVGGAIKGAELLNNARVKKTIAQVDGIKAALATFEDKYSMLPGDAEHADERLPGCTAANFCFIGNADGHVGIINPANNLNLNQTTAGGLGEETSQFWKHLAMADMIGGIIPSADTSAPSFGQTHPIVVAGVGGFTVLSIIWSGFAGPSGHYLRLQSSLIGTPLKGPGRNALSPKYVRYVDEKIDNGAIDSGDVVSMFNDSGTLRFCEEMNLPGGACTAGCGGTCDTASCAAFIRIR